MTEPNFDLADRSIYRHWVSDRIRFSDQDSTGHVNNVAFAAYVETGRVDFMRTEVMAHREPDEVLIVVRLAIDYREEARWPGTVDVGTRIVRVGNRSCTVGSGIFHGARALATAETVMVFARDGKAVPIDGAGRARLLTLLAE